MSPHEIDYGALIDRTIRDFKPVKRLWSASTRLFFWILFETAILAGTGSFLGYRHLSVVIDRAALLLTLGLPILASVAAAFLALKGAVPGREVTRSELVLLIALTAATLAVGSASSVAVSGLIEGGISVAGFIGVAALPWSVLFWAVRRGVPLQPAKTGMTIGLAAFSFALGVIRFIDYESGPANQLSWLAFSAILLMLLSAVAGSLWLDRIGRWHRFQGSDDAPAAIPWLSARILLPAAIAASLVAFVFVLRVRTAFVPIPDFDRTIETYERSLAAGFRSNVPSASIEAMLTVYVERGMPAYMWDFGSEGFKLVGGRWQPLPDGTPVTYTWFRGPTGGVICMMKQIDAFNLPAGVREEHHDLFFYKYRGFSVCLINIGGYGNFIGVIAAPIPIKQFVTLVLRVVN